MELTFEHHLSTSAVRPARARRLAAAAALDRAGFVLLLSMFPLTAIPYGSVQDWWSALFQCLAFGVGIVWLIEGWLKGCWDLRLQPWLLPAMLLVVFVFLQTMPFTLGSADSSPGFFWGGATISADPYETRMFAWKLLGLFTCALALQRQCRSPARLKLVLAVMVGTALASAVFGITRQALQQDTGFLLAHLNTGEGYAQFINKNHFALYAEMAFGPLLALTVCGAIPRDKRLLAAVPLLLLLVAIILSYSRGAVFAVLGQAAVLGVLLLVQRRRQQREGSYSNRMRTLVQRTAIGLALLACVSIGALWVGGDLLLTRFASLPGEINAHADETHAGVRRAEIWRATWQLFRAHPLLGSGFAAYPVAITEFHDASGKWTPEAAHNEYLELAASGGLLGALLVLSTVGAFLFTSMRNLLNPVRAPLARIACTAALVGIAGVAIHSAVDFGLHITANLLAFFALAAIASCEVGARESRGTEGQCELSGG